MNGIAVREAGFRADLFKRTADMMNISPAMVEKDFWVCWTLLRLFALPDLKAHIIFKGGTTLSKVFNVIKRFSEDIDITIGKEFIGFSGENDPEKAQGKNKREALIEKMVSASTEAVNGYMLMKLRKEIETVLGTSGIWSLEHDKDAEDGQTLLFYYPVATDALSYVRPAVKIEFGARSDVWPSEKHRIKAYSAEFFPAVFKEPEVEVTVLSAERTFWEKATILHQEAHRPEGSPTPIRYSRHYYDLAMLDGSQVCKRALSDIGLLRRVVEHKKMFFRCGWAQYDKATAASLKLVPPVYRIDQLIGDYSKMAPMMFEACPDFSEIIAVLKNLEKRINKI